MKLTFGIAREYYTPQLYNMRRGSELKRVVFFFPRLYNISVTDFSISHTNICMMYTYETTLINK